MPEKRCKISWKVFSLLLEQPNFRLKNNLFKVDENTGFYGQFGISLDYCYLPLLLTPTIQFYQKINSLLRRKNSLHLQELKPPYTIEIKNLGIEAKLNVSGIRLFPPNILSMTVELSGLPSSLEPQQLIDLQYLHELKPANLIVQRTIGLAENLNVHDIRENPSYVAHPGIRLDGVCPADLLPDYFVRNLNTFVGILIRNPDFARMDESISLKIWEKNAHLTAKTARKKLLINKQGLLYLTAEIEAGTLPRSQPPEFARTFNLYETALFVHTFLDQYITLKLENELLADSTMYKIRPWVEAPEIIFRSFSYKEVWETLMEEFALRNRLDYLLRQVDFEREHQFKNEYLRVTGTSSSEVSVLFSDIKQTIANSVLEENIKAVCLVDLAQSEISYRQGAFKACVIMLGSVLEGIMLGTIRRSDVLAKLIADPNRFRRLNNLGVQLPGLADRIAGELSFEDYKTIIHQLIPDIEKLKIEGIQFFRNAVHPWKAVKEPQIYRSFDQSRALVHLASLKILARTILTWNP